jgi:probable HAF family extracellular repeat protein
MATLKVKMAAAAVVLFLSITTGRTWGEVRYTVTDLATLGGNQSAAYGINNSGQIVGYFRTTGNSSSFLYDGGSVQDLGTLGGAESIASGINNSGQVVGWATNSSGMLRAFLYSGTGAMTDLGTSGGADAASRDQRYWAGCRICRGKRR